MRADAELRVKGKNCTEYFESKGRIAKAKICTYSSNKFA